jgi:hypothetical protein
VGPFTLVPLSAQLDPNHSSLTALSGLDFIYNALARSQKGNSSKYKSPCPRVGSEEYTRCGCGSGNCQHAVLRRFRDARCALCSVQQVPKSPPKCGACGVVGHTRNMKVCSKYTPTRKVASGAASARADEDSLRRVAAVVALPAGPYTVICIHVRVQMSRAPPRESETLLRV